MQGWNDYDWVVSGTDLNTWRNVNTNKTDVQLCNGPNSSNMFVMAFNKSTVPYYFQMSNSLGSAGLSKTSSLQSSIFQNRGVVVENNGAGLYYSLGNIAVDGNAVDFVDIQDTIKQNRADSVNVKTSSLRPVAPARKSITDVNMLFFSKPFEINENSKLTFSDFVEVGDSSAAASVLGNKGYITFKAELVDAVTGTVLGKIKESNYNRASLQSKKASPYTLDKIKLKSKQAKVKITAVSNIDSLAFTLINHYTDAGETNELSKATTPQELTFEPANVITEYALEQNYPNPFNPSTTIRYQIPNAGHVILKVYDMLGREVATLVDGEKEVGSYSATFDGERISSGVYIMRLVAQSEEGKSFTQTKKMVLMK